MARGAKTVERLAAEWCIRIYVSLWEPKPLSDRRRRGGAWKTNEALAEAILRIRREHDERKRRGEDWRTLLPPKLDADLPALLQCVWWVSAVG